MRCGLFLALLATVHFATLIATPAAADELDDRLAALEAGGAIERRDAEAELAAILDDDHAARLATWIDGAAAEGRARLASTLARRDRFLGLVLALDAQRDGVGPVADVVRGALDGLIARFETGFFAEPLSGYALRLELDRLARELEPTMGRVDLARPPIEVARDLARWDGMPLRLVIDPELVGAPAPQASLFATDDTHAAGTWRELLSALEVLDLAVEAHLFAPESELDEPQIAFLRVTRRGLDGRGTARDWLVRLLERMDAAEDRRERVESARALASTGWPAAQAFLLERLRTNGDTRALVGLAWAAELGVVPPSFPTRTDARFALDAALADLASTRPDAGALARDVLEGLVHLPRLAPGGEPLFDAPLVPAVSEVMATGAGAAPGAGAGAGARTGASGAARARARFALELTARGRFDAPGLRERLAGWIGDERVDRVARRWALAAWTRIHAAAAPTPARALELVRGCADEREADELSWLLAASGASVPPAWRQDGALDGLDGRALAIALGWALAREDDAAAANALATALSGRARGASGEPSFAGRDELARVLELVRRRAGGDAARRALEGALERAAGVQPAAFALELRALAGFVPADDADARERLYAAAVARRDAEGHGDPHLLATLVVGATADNARALLLGEFVGACESHADARVRRARVERALGRAVAVLLAAGEDDAARAFAASLGRLARQRLREPLGGRDLVLRAAAPGWPRPTGWDADDLLRPGPVR